eukprot:scaffold34376_cov23-Tisochrysis_lutea.AAC.2
MGVKAQGWQRRPWLKLGGTGHFGDRGKDSGGGGGGAGGVGNTKEGSRHEGLAFPGAVVLDMREITVEHRGSQDLSCKSPLSSRRPASLVAGPQGQPATNSHHTHLRLQTGREKSPQSSRLIASHCRSAA